MKRISQVFKQTNKNMGTLALREGGTLRGGEGGLGWNAPFFFLSSGKGITVTKRSEENRSDIKAELCSMGNCSSAHECRNRNGIDSWVLVYCWYVHISILDQ
jgi:hypothetical protein